MIRIKRILCPVDFIPASDKAAHYAVGLAADYGAKIHLVHVITPVLPMAFEYLANAGDLFTSMEEGSRDQMKKLVKKLMKRGVEVTSEVLTGDVHQVIGRVISTLKPDLVVMGSHARSAVERFFMGSVAEWLMRHSPVPVLVISEKQKILTGKRRPAKRAA